MLLVLCALAALAGPIPVEVRAVDDGWELVRGGEPYVLNGAGGHHALDVLARAGGTSIRTWGVGDETGALLDDAHAHGLTVSLGIWLGHERHGFDYDNPEHVSEQLASARAAVLAHRDHPALLMWGVGNEMEGFAEGDDPAVWSAVCEVAAMVQDLDPNHPVMTTTADIGGGRIAGVEGCEHIDIHGVNSYGGGPSVADRYVEGGGTRPLVLTEYGHPGIWEIGTTDYGAPPELTSTEKAAIYGRLSTEVVGADPRILGGYAFLWGWKTEATTTWFGLFLNDGSPLGAVEALAGAWGGSVANRAPVVSPLVLEGDDRVEPGSRVEVTWTVDDPDGDVVQTGWTLRREIVETSVGGDPQGTPPAIPEAIVSTSTDGVVLQMPESNGVHRLYAVARDGKGAAATASLPILVGEPRDAADPLPMPWFVYQDAGIGGPWAPTGWMGDEGAFTLATDWADGCVSPPSCIRVETVAGVWSGVAWQTPPNNWGEHAGGADLRSARFLKFWVRADHEGVSGTFGVGLVGDDKPYPDSVKLEKKVTLGRQWQEVRLRMKKDRSHLITGFWWILPGQRPTAIYLDDIRFE